MTVALTETPTVGLGQYIRETRFSVPRHQRDYSWKEEYVAAFLDDISNAMDHNEELYFCGLMVLVRAEDKLFQVLDGQQRLATTLIILSAIRNWMRGYTAYQRIQAKIEERYLGESDLDEEDVRPKLTLNAANNDYFRRYVIQSVPLKDMRDAAISCKRGNRNYALIEAIVQVNYWVNEKAAVFPAPDNAKDYFVKLATYLEETVQVVRLIVSGDEAAYSIFETLNDRGMELSPLDLVKNHLFSKAEKKDGRGKRDEAALRDLEQRWTEMMTLLAPVKSDAFLRSFWATKHGSIEGKGLFKSFKKAYSDSNAAYAVSLDMRAAAEKYVALRDADDAIWSPHSDDTKRSISALSIIGATQFHPVMLAAIDVLPNGEVTKLMRLLEVLAVRYQLAQRGRPGRIESLSARLAKAIANKSVTTTAQAFTQLRELYTDDTVFTADFASMKENNSKKAAYLLRRLEYQARVQAGVEHPKELEPSKVTIEHILPKSPSAAWPQELRKNTELHNDLLYRLGNLCLSDVNRALGNKGFSDKRPSFRGSEIEMTKHVAQYHKWGQVEIESRQKHMASLALREWRYQ